MKIGKLLGVAVMIGIIGGICYTTGALDDAKPVIENLKGKAENGIQWVKSISDNPKAAVEVFINDKKQSLQAEDQLPQLAEKDEADLEETPFYICDGESATHEWRSAEGDCFHLLETAFKKATSPFIWFENYEDDLEDGVAKTCEFYNVDYETMLAKIDESRANSAAESDGTYDISKLSKASAQYFTRFNKDYRLNVDRLKHIELPMTEDHPFNGWRDAEWDGLSPDEFYKTYKVITTISAPELKGIIAGNMYNEERNPHFTKNACLVFEFDITAISADEHPLEWFPQEGETKTVSMILQMGVDQHGRCCMRKGAVL